MATAKKGGAARGGKTAGRGGATKKSGARGGAAKKATGRAGAKGAAKGGARGGAKSAAKKSTAKRGAAKKGGARKSAGKRAPNPAFMRPMQPDEQLAAVVGNDPMPRTEVTKRLWAYIKKNGLQDGRTINADDRLRTLFGGKKSVTMFELARIANQHLRATS
jgi:chromatin remodeling complex protein RSC6